MEPAVCELVFSQAVDNPVKSLACSSAISRRVLMPLFVDDSLSD
jgi:hypothetical protein